MVISGNLGDRGVDRLIMSNGFGRLSQANARATCVATIVRSSLLDLDSFCTVRCVHGCTLIQKFFSLSLIAKV